MGVNFNLVEGNDEDFIERFIDAYNNPENSIRDVLRIMDISDGRYYRVKRELSTEGLIDPDLKKKIPKYYSRCRDGYVISKFLNGKTVSYTTVDNVDDAEFIVERLKEYDWDKGMLPQIMGELYGGR